MIGIEAIASYFPSRIQSNFDLKERFEIDEYFITEKIGVQQVHIKSVEEETSDLCVKAFDKLQNRNPQNKDEIEALIVVTQNPDLNIPHTAAIVHGKLELPETCACFDISLGCSGFVYALSVMEGFMQRNGFKRALLFTADPYSKIINPDDKNTVLLFGDAAAVTVLSDSPNYTAGEFTFGTIGKLHKELICTDNILNMNGRAIFDFAARYIPGDVKRVCERNDISMEAIDLFVFHQGSKYLIDTLIKRIKLPTEKVPFHAALYGNTVSSSIPIMLEDYLSQNRFKNILISGFGVGLSYSSTILKSV